MQEMQWAATKGCTDAVKLLLKKGSPIDPFNQPGARTFSTSNCSHEPFLRISISAKSQLQG